MEVEIGFAVFILCLIGSRIIAEKGIKVLTIEEKGKLVDSFSSMRAYNLIPIVLLVLVYYILLTKTSLNEELVNGVYWAGLLLYVVIIYILTNKKLVSLDLPSKYVKIFNISRIIQYIGIAILFFFVI